MPQWLTGCKALRADSIHPGKPPTECLLPQAHTSRSLTARHTHAHHTCRDGTAPADARTVDVDVDVDVDVEPCLGFAPPAPAAALTSADMMTSTDPEPSPEKIQAFRPAVRLLTRPPSTPLNRCRDGSSPPHLAHSPHCPSSFFAASIACATHCSRDGLPTLPARGPPRRPDLLQPLGHRRPVTPRHRLAPHQREHRASDRVSRRRGREAFIFAIYISSFTPSRPSRPPAVLLSHAYLTFARGHVRRPAH